MGFYILKIASGFQSLNKAFGKTVKDITLQSVMKEELVGCVTDAGGDEDAINQVNHGRLFQLYFSKLEGDNSSISIQDGDGTLKVPSSVVCASAALLPLIARMVHVNGLMTKSTSMKSFLEKFKSVTAAEGDKLLEASRMKFLVATWSNIHHRYGLFFSSSYSVSLVIS